MTVQEIQDYIQKRIEKYDEIPNEHQDAKFKQATADLVIVLGMLDELEPKAKWETSPRVNILHCSNCNHISCIDTNYCSNCGARMEVEDDNSSTNV